MVETNISTKGKVVIISMIPRSLSSVLYASLCNFDNCIGFFEPLKDIHFFNSGISDYNPYSINSINELEEKIENIFISSSNTKWVLLKDNYFDIQRKESKQFIKKLVDKYDVKFLFLFRHPKLILSSWNRIANQQYINWNGGFTYKEMIKIRYSFADFKAQFEELGGLLIDTEELTAAPETYLKAICNYLNIEFHTKYLTFPKMETSKKLPYSVSIHPNKELFFGEMLKSTSIIKKEKKDIDKVTVQTLPNVGEDEYLFKLNEEIPIFNSLKKISDNLMEKLKETNKDSTELNICSYNKNSNEENPDKKFRDYDNSDIKVKQFYFTQHKNQTLDFVLELKKDVFPLGKYKLNFTEILSIIENTIDNSDPDFGNGSQILHCISTGEQCRNLFPNENWMHLVGFLHDFGKIIMNDKMYNLPDWAVVGDTFPVGCQFSDKIIFSEAFKDNLDSKNSKYNTKYGIYEPNCGFDNVHFSFSHDEFMYQFILKNKKCDSEFPDEGLYVIRYHSFYSWHQHNEYDYLASKKDWKNLERLRLFQKCDLYTKSTNIDKSKTMALLPYYKNLFKKYINEIDTDLIL